MRPMNMVAVVSMVVIVETLDAAVIIGVVLVLVLVIIRVEVRVRSVE